MLLMPLKKKMKLYNWEKNLIITFTYNFYKNNNLS